MDQSETILIISDSHHDDEMLERINQKFNHIKYKFHGGDTALEYNDPLTLDYYKVKGNHDYLPYFPVYQIITIHHRRILLIHGHLHGIYGGYSKIIPLAKKNNCSIVIHGHTHIPHVEVIDGIFCINPGSLMFNRGSYGYGTYVLLTLHDHDKFEYHFYHHETDEEVTDFVLKDGVEWLETLKKLVNNEA